MGRQLILNPIKTYAYFAKYSSAVLSALLSLYKYIFICVHFA